MSSDLEMLDVDFEDAARTAGRVMGSLGTNGLYKGTRFGDDVEPIPEDRWDAIVDAQGDNTLDTLVTRIYDQNGEPSCVSNATCQAHEILQALQHGKDRVVHLSAISLYMRVGSRNSGSMVDDNFNELCNVGILPLDNDENKKRFAHTMPANGYGTKYPDDWKKTAELFRGVEAYIIGSRVEFVTAILKGFPVVYGRKGHSICACRVVRRSGKLFVKYANSWGKDWSEGGFGYDSMGMISSGAEFAFALRSIVSPQELTGV